MAVLLPVGTRKGLFLLRSDDDRKDWELEGPLLPGWPVYHAIVDPRDGVLYAATNSFIYGGTVHRSSDLGANWERAEELGLPEESGLKLNATWHIEPGPADEPDTLWLGGDPGVLFRSDDGGTTWEPNRGILEHPTREKWVPGAGGMCCHSIQLVDSKLYVGISAAGAFRSEDGGENWEPLDRDGLPSGFGFALALDPSDPDVAYVIPEQSQEHHYTAEGRLGVYRTADGGATWELASA